MKTLSVFMASVVVCISLSACDKGQLNQNQPEEDSGQEEVTPPDEKDEPQKPDDSGQTEEQQKNTGKFTITAVRNLTEETFGTVDAAAPRWWSSGDGFVFYCPQASVSVKEAVTLNDVPDNSDSHVFTTSMMYWGNSPEHDFYAAFPATSMSSDCSVRFSLPSMQTVSGSNAPDMSLTRLVAAEKSVPVTSGSVTLSFVPAFSMLDVIFTASEDVTVSRVVVSSEDGSPIVGDYTATCADGSWRFAPAINGTVSSRVAVSINGTEGLALSAGSKAAIQVFLFPMEYKGLTISLLAPDGKVISSENGDAVFSAARRSTVDFGTLPALSSWGTVYDSWMKYIPDNVLVSDLSIPGTHDAATYSNGSFGIFLSSFYTCQSKDFIAQLTGGVRLFDLRPDGDDLMIYHATGNTNISLSQALGYMKTYMEGHPTEGCIAFIKEENSWNASAVSPALAAYADHIVNYTAKLTMGQLRGKILVVSRTNYPGTIYGGNFSKGWPDNTTDGSVGIGYAQGTRTENFYLQDQYSSSVSTSTKLASFKAYADKARKEKNPSDWLCNHTSLSGSPKSNARTINPEAAAYINANPGRTAIVMTDFACDSAVSGDILVNAIVNQNVRYIQATK